MVNRWLVLVALWVGTMCLAGCAGSAAHLSGSAWQLTTLSGQSLIAGTEITLAFDKTTVSGSGGCNTFGGSYTANKETLSLEGLYATEMGCMDPKGVLEQEQRYLAALGGGTSYRIENSQLVVFDTTDTELLVFDAASDR